MKTIKLFLIICFVFGICIYSLGAFAAQEVSVVSCSGDVQLVLPSSDKHVKCKNGIILKKGTRIKTGKDSRVSIAFGKGKDNTINVEEDTNVVVAMVGDEKLELIDGELFVLLRDLPKGSEFKVRTPCAVCGARGTGWSMKTTDNATEIMVFDNKVFLQCFNLDGSLREGDFWTERGYKRVVEKHQLPSDKIKLSKEELADLDEEALFIGNVASLLNNKDKARKQVERDEARLKALDSRMERAEFGARSGFDRIMEGGGAAGGVAGGGGRGDDDD